MKLDKKTIMIDMDEVIVVGKFSDYLVEFLGNVNFDNLHTQNRQDLIKGREEEFRKIYKYKNLYKDENGNYIAPLSDCVDVIEKLNERYDVYIVTSYIWKEDVIDASTNLKNKFIFMKDKIKIHYDIGIDDRISNLESCNRKLLFTEFRNKNVTKEELENIGIKRVNNWLDVEKEILG